MKTAGEAMKTLGEEMAARRKVEEAAREAHHARCHALYESSKDVPLYVAPEKSDRTDYARARTGLREALAAGVRGNVTLYEYACDHCHTQLMDPTPGVVLTSSPPKRNAGCPGCGWRGYVPC